MAVRKSAAQAVTYDGTAVKNPNPLETVKMSRRVASVRSERGYLETKYDGSPATHSRILRRQFEQKYAVKNIRNSKACTWRTTSRQGVLGLSICHRKHSKVRRIRPEPIGEVDGHKPIVASIEIAPIEKALPGNTILQPASL
jgi:hypothetical protein